MPSFYFGRCRWGTRGRRFGRILVGVSLWDRMHTPWSVLWRVGRSLVHKVCMKIALFYPGRYLLRRANRLFVLFWVGRFLFDRSDRRLDLLWVGRCLLGRPDKYAHLLWVERFLWGKPDKSVDQLCPGRSRQDKGDRLFVWCVLLVFRMYLEGKEYKRTGLFFPGRFLVYRDDMLFDLFYPGMRLLGRRYKMSDRLYVERSLWDRACRT